MKVAGNYWKVTSASQSKNKNIKNRNSLGRMQTRSMSKRDATGRSDVLEKAPASIKKKKIYDAEQEKFMQEEFCILVNYKDEIIGRDTKKNCHLNENIEKGLLHRAFSAFLFDSEGRLLLQQRSEKKITFPDCWTNTCCSHPIDNNEDERDGVKGVSKAVVRKLQHELGIEPDQIATDAKHFKYLTRIHYKAPSNDQWGEHEIDYIYFLQPSKTPTIKLNPGEVRDSKFVTADELKQMLDQAKHKKILITPWFRMICERFLFDWWKTLLENPSKLKTNDPKIHKVE